MAGRLNEFVVVFVSIVLQSLPFVLIGVFASAMVQHYLNGQLVARWMPHRRLPAVLLASAVGFVVPVCDCGVIPLARRLTAKGVPVYAAVTFLIAAPVLNPIVLLSTGFAFQGDARVIALRMGMTLSVALVVGLATSFLLPDARARLPTFAASLSDDDAPPGAGLLPSGSQTRGPLLLSGSQIRNPGAAALSLNSVEALRGGPSRYRALIQQASGEYFDVIFYIILGALFTATTQTFVPRGELTALGAHPLGSIAALMPMATLLSICSEADAFVARAFSTTFSLGAVLAFMTIGQIVDLRNGVLLVRTLGGRLVGLLVAISYPLVFVEATIVNRVLGNI